MSSERRDFAPPTTTAPANDTQGSVLELKTTDRRGRASNNNGCRVQSWSFQPHIAHLVVNHQQPVPSLADIRNWTERVNELGYSVVRTNALARGTSRQMECAGFTVLQELVLLELNSPRAALKAVLESGSDRLATQHVEPEQIPNVSTIDVDAFGRDWGLSESAIADVCSATPRHRLRGAGEPLAAFAISGRDGRQGFLQRLSVSPARQRQGLGRALVLDSLEWMTRWRVQRVLVNTALDNYAALALYRGLGFRRIGERLRVYERTLP